jgi:hypothetical protein
VGPLARDSVGKLHFVLAHYRAWGHFAKHDMLSAQVILLIRAQLWFECD